MKKAFAVAAAMLALVVNAPAGADVIGFTDGFAPGSWAVAFSGTLTGGGASTGSVTQTPSTFTIVGGNSLGGCVGGVYAFLGPVPSLRHPPLDGVQHVHLPLGLHHRRPRRSRRRRLRADRRRRPDRLVGSGGAVSQSGDKTIHAVSSIGWFVNCTDCTEARQLRNSPTSPRSRCRNPVHFHCWFWDSQVWVSGRDASTRVKRSQERRRLRPPFFSRPQVTVRTFSFGEANSRALLAACNIQASVSHPP